MTYLDDLFGVTGKTALVTGGASGIGRMIATCLVCGGARVMIASRKAEECKRAGSEIAEFAGVSADRIEGFGGDVASETGLAALVAEVRKRTDRLHILVNNAGISWGEPLNSFPHAAWAKVMGVNVAGLFTLTRDLLPLLDRAASDADPARVINLGSVMGTQPFADGAYSYSASKAAVHHLTKILANELAARRITVNALAPGPFQSRMTAFAIGSQEKAERVGQGVPLGRIGLPSDIAGATLYLCSKAGAYVTGAVLPIDGGMSVENANTLFKDVS